MTSTISFRVANLQPEIFDPVTGEVTSTMLYERTNDGRTRVSVSLAPYETFFVVFRHRAGLHVTELQRGGQAVPMSDDMMVI